MAGSAVNYRSVGNTTNPSRDEEVGIGIGGNSIGGGDSIGGSTHGSRRSFPKPRLIFGRAWR